MARRVNVRFHAKTSTIFFWLMALAGMALAFTVAALPSLARNRALSQELHRLEQENGRLRQRLEHLRLEEEALRTDPVYNEALARRELGLVKPGERVLWTPSPKLQNLSHSPLTQASVAFTAPDTEATLSGPWLARLGPPGRYLVRVLDRLSTDPAARRDGYLLAMGLLTAALLLFGRPERPTRRRRSEVPTHTRA